MNAHVVNRALVAAMNELPTSNFPRDGGIGAGKPIGAVDFVVDGGDIANREEMTQSGTIQPASVSWGQFVEDYAHGLRLSDVDGRAAALYVVPGNHDVSNAIGFYKPMAPARDGSALAAIYDLMMAPTRPRTADSLVYPRDRVDTSRDIRGVHLVFLTIWPDSAERRWFADDLTHVSRTTPVLIFTHDPPDAEARHFTNPNGEHDVNARDGFENLLVDEFADGPSTGVASTREQQALEIFVRQHPNITAYFHGHANWNQFYDWTGPDRTVALHTFRVDSPMKGAVSATDETRLSFQVATLDMTSRTMTVRECFWNRQPMAVVVPIAWGDSITIPLDTRDQRSSPIAVAESGTLPKTVALMPSR